MALVRSKLDGPTEMLKRLLALAPPLERHPEVAVRARVARVERERLPVLLDRAIEPERLLVESAGDVVESPGAHDREEDVLSDAERGAWLDGTLGRLSFACGSLGVYRLLSGLLARPAVPAARPLRQRVDLTAYRTNVEEMIRLAQQASARVVLLDLVLLGPFDRGALQELAARWKVPLVDGREQLDEAFDRIAQGLAYREEAQAWLDFYRAHVVSVRPVYFGPEFYQRRYPTEREQQQFMTLMADPIHPNALGHHVLADALVPLVCPGPPGG